MSNHEIPPFDMLTGHAVPFEGLGDVLNTVKIRDEFESVLKQAKSRIEEKYGLIVTFDRVGVTKLDEIIKEMWNEGWDPTKGDVNLFVRDFGIIITESIRKCFLGNLVFRSEKDLSHSSIWWPELKIEAFPFHKTLKCIFDRNEGRLTYYFDSIGKYVERKKRRNK